MNEPVYNSLQFREIFHLEFLRWLSRKLKPENYALKGGVNLRFFFHSIRYSEDMDLDVSGITVGNLKEIVMKILMASSFQDALKPFGIDDIIVPDISKAKQTETTQRFKVHLLTIAGEDLFTKIEFSRRGLKVGVVVESALDVVLREYKIPPLLLSHYDIHSAITQKIEALAMRSRIQARDVFDIYILLTQISYRGKVDKSVIGKAEEHALAIPFEQFRDTVVSYLTPDDQEAYSNASLWDEIKLKVQSFLQGVNS